MCNSEKRDDIITLRAVAILLVVFGHSIIIYSDAWNLYSTTVQAPLFNVLKNAVNIVQMPLFFSISGFCLWFTLLKRPRLSWFIRNKVRRILIPFLVVGVFWLLPIRMFVGYSAYQNRNLMTVIGWDILLGHDNGHLWFLPTLFLMLIFTCMVWTVCEWCWGRREIFVSAITVFMFVSLFAPVPDVPYLGTFIEYYKWFGLGVLIHVAESVIRRVYATPMKYVICFFLIINLIAMASGWNFVPCVGVLIGFLTVVSAYAVCPSKTTATLSIISRDSMGIYLFHSPLIYISFAFWPNIPSVIMVLINFVGFGLFALLLTELVRRAGLCWVIGE